MRLVRGIDVDRYDDEQIGEELEKRLLNAIQTNHFVISPEELNGRSLVSVLREKLIKRD